MSISKKILAIAGIVGATAYLFASKKRMDRTRRDKSFGKREISRWEGEGGNVPAVSRQAGLVAFDSDSEARESA